MPLPDKFLLRCIAPAVVAILVTSCGGSGGGDDPGPSTGTISGTAATGRPMMGATVRLTCASRHILVATTGVQGTYLTEPQVIRTPCAGQATLSPSSFNGVLFTGFVANFTPLTHLLVQVMLAAAAPGDDALEMAEFLNLVQNDETFARNVSSPEAVARYRNAVVVLVRRLLVEAGRDPELAAILSTTDWESAIFSANGLDRLDQVLDTLRDILQNADGNVLASVLALARALGNQLPTIPRRPTGGAGTGGAGGTG